MNNLSEMMRHIERYLSQSIIDSANRCAQRLMLILNNGMKNHKKTVLLAYGGGKDSSYMVAYVRYIQGLVLAKQGHTFQLRISTNRHAGMNDGVMEKIDRVYRSLNIYGDESVECLITDGLLIRPFERHLKMPDAVRRHNGVANPLHSDHIVRDAADTGLAVTEIRHQLSCVVCLQECNSGGVLRLYNKKWNPKDEYFKIPGELGYRDGIKDGCDSFDFSPQRGDIYIFNPVYYHEIDRVVGDTRITMAFFFGIRDENMKQAIAWS